MVKLLYLSNYRTEVLEMAFALAKTIRCLLPIIPTIIFLKLIWSVKKSKFLRMKQRHTNLMILLFHLLKSFMPVIQIGRIIPENYGKSPKKMDLNFWKKIWERSMVLRSARMERNYTLMNLFNVRYGFMI